MRISTTFLAPAALSLLLLPSVANALTVVGSTIYGLPEDAPFELKLDTGAINTFETDGNGQATVTEQEDDDDNSLLIPPGSNGSLIDTRTGEVVALVRNGMLTTAGSAFMDEGSTIHKMYMYVGLDYVEAEGTAKGMEEGLQAAFDSGFTGGGSAEDNAWGGSFGIGMFCGDEDLWGQTGSVLWNIALIYSQYSEIEASFLVKQDGPEGQEALEILSSGQDELSSLAISFGPHMYLANNFSVFGELGWAWYRTEGSGTIRRANDGLILESFSDNSVDGAGQFKLGAAWDMNEKVRISASYTQSLDDNGPQDNYTPANYSLGLSFAL